MCLPLQDKKALILRNAGLMELKKVMRLARLKRTKADKLEENMDMNW